MLAENVAQGATGVVLIVTTFLGAVVAITTAVLTYKTHIRTIEASAHAKEAATNSREANLAVNCKEPDEDRLFDMVAETRRMAVETQQWREVWPSVIMDHIEDAKLQTVTEVDAVARRIGRLDQDNAVQHAQLRADISGVKSDLTEHVTWEMDVKYPAVGEWDGSTERRSTAREDSLGNPAG